MRTIAMLAPFFLFGCVGDTPVLPDAGTDSSPPGDTGPGQDVQADSPPGMIDVNGTVVDEFAAPIAGANVAIGSLNTMTSMTGAFSLKATPPYDVTVVAKTSITTSGKRVTAMLGLTTPMPTIQIQQGLVHTLGTLQVAWSGATIAAGDRLFFSFAPTTPSTDVGVFLNGPLSSPFTFAMKPTWNGASPATGTVFALHVAGGGTTFPTTIDESGSQTYTMTDSQNLTVSSIAMSSIPSGTVSGTINYNGQNPNAVHLRFRPNAKAFIGFVDQNFTATTFSFPMPGAPYKGQVVAFGGTNQYFTGAWATGLVSNTTNIAIKLPDAIAAMTPAAAATGVDTSTVFSWSPVTGGAYDLQIACGNGQPSYDADIITYGTQGRIPDTTALGVALPAGMSCVWTAAAFATPTSKIDDLAGVGGWRVYANNLVATVNGWFSSTRVRAFTLK